MDDRGQPHVARYHGMLGTVVEIRIRAGDAAAAGATERRAVDEIRRLERVFSVYDDESTLVRWRTGTIDEPGPELRMLLASALDWQARSGGAFNPMTGVATCRWRRAEADGVVPADAELDALASQLRVPPFVVTPHGVERTGDCTGLDLNAFAKGAIVDAAMAVADDGTVDDLVINAGGDLAHRGNDVVAVGVEDPLRPFDNEPPLAVLEVANEAVATSGGARRGVCIAGRRYSHVLDPRTCRPVDHLASATVVAPDAATADAVATIVGVLPIDEGCAFVAGLERVSCLLVDASGAVVRA